MAGYTIRQFRPEDTKRHRIFLLLGGRGTGKTTILFDLLYRLRDRVDLPLAMTATKSTADRLREVMPHHLVHDKGYDYGLSDSYMSICKRLVQRGTPRSTFLILDDCAYDKGCLKSQNMRELAFNGRHQKSTVFLTSQYLMNMPCDIRANVDYVICLREPIKANQKKLYEYFFGEFASQKEFTRVLSECTKNYGALVLDKTNATGSLVDSISYYRASPQLPPFRLGRPVFFRLSDSVDRLLESQEEKVENVLQIE